MKIDNLKKPGLFAAGVLLGVSVYQAVKSDD